MHRSFGEIIFHSLSPLCSQPFGIYGVGEKEKNTKIIFEFYDEKLSTKYQSQLAMWKIWHQLAKRNSIRIFQCNGFDVCDSSVCVENREKLMQNLCLN